MVTRGARYGFLNAKLRTRLAQILRLDAVTDLAGTRSLSEAAEKLKDTPFAELDELYRQTGDIRSCELRLLQREISEAEGVERLAPERERRFLSVFHERFDVENLKALLRVWYERQVRGRSIEAHIPYLCRRAFHFSIPFDDILIARSFEELVRALAGIPYAGALEEALRDARESKSVYPLELALDRAYFMRCKAALEELPSGDRRRVSTVPALEIDRFNFVMAVRYRLLYRDAGESAAALFLSGGVLFPAGRLKLLSESDRLFELLSATALARFPALAEFPEVGVPEESSRGSAGYAERLFRRLHRIEAKRMLAGYPFTLATAVAYSVLIQQEIRNVASHLNAVYFGADVSEAVTMP